MKINNIVKAVSAAITSIGLAVSFAGCGASSANGKITLSYLSWTNEQVSKPYIEEFEKLNPNIDIDFSYSPPTGQYIQTLQTRLVGNQAPDVFIITSENKADLMKNGYVKDLTDEAFMKNIDKANKDFVSKDGRVYGMSTSSWASGIVYNKDLLAKVGATTVPSSWSEFLSLCKKLKAAGITPYVEPLADGASRLPDAFLGAQFAKKGVDVTKLADESKQTPGADQKEATAQWMELYNQGIVSRNAVGINGDAMKSQFTSGNVAMISDGSWDFPSFESSSIDWGYAQLPAMEPGLEQYSQGSPSPALAIYSKLDGDQLKAAEKFLAFMTSKWALDQNSKNGDAVTVNGYTSAVTKQYQDVYEKNIKSGKYFLITNFYAKPSILLTTLQSQTQELVQGSISTNQWAAAVDAKMASAQ